MVLIGSLPVSCAVLRPDFGAFFFYRGKDFFNFSGFLSQNRDTDPNLYCVFSKTFGATLRQRTVLPAGPLLSALFQRYVPGMPLPVCWET
jgi:hypothetical protein